MWLPILLQDVVLSMFVGVVVVLLEEEEGVIFATSSSGFSSWKIGNRKLKNETDVSELGLKISIFKVQW